MCSCDDCKGQKVSILNCAYYILNSLRYRSNNTHLFNYVMKALNAYEFERHAGAKSKHPNNHIYFENGKSIYAVVQELKNSPQETLFDAIQTVTGSTINQKNFRSWKGNNNFQFPCPNTSFTIASMVHALILTFFSALFSIIPSCDS